MPPLAKLPLSVCILVKNEADRLPRCLAALSEMAEIICLDSGSTDGSQEIIRSAGATLLEHEWLGFGATRTVLFRQATQPWVLWLDADEVVTPELMSSLRRLFADPMSHAAYQVNRTVIFQGQRVRHGDWFPDWIVRLFRADSWTMDERIVHERILIDGSIGQLDGLLEHYSFRDWDDLARRSAYYARLWAEMGQHRGKRPVPLEAEARASWRFLRGFVFKFGFLDGTLGYRVALACAREVRLKYRTLREANRPN